MKFYGDAFGWSISADNPMGYGIVDNHGEGINGGIDQAPPRGERETPDVLHTGR